MRWLVVSAVLLLVVMTGLSLWSRRVPDLGVVDGGLTPLPDRPSGVSSTARDPAKRVDPLPMGSDAAQARAALAKIMSEVPRCELLEESEHYMRFECTSPILRFRDDLEFHLRPAQQIIHLRAAARVGYSDMGVNRARVRAIRSMWSDRDQPGK